MKNYEEESPVPFNACPRQRSSPAASANDLKGNATPLTRILDAAKATTGGHRGFTMTGRRTKAREKGGSKVVILRWPCSWRGLIDYLFWGELVKFMSRTRLQMIRLSASANEAEHVAGEVGRRRQRQGRSRSQGDPGGSGGFSRLESAKSLDDFLS